jgi:AcrR family transcriptional regulator
MGRSELHSVQAILDGARQVVVADGVRAATVGSIAAASGAPTGSIYHRFNSVDELLARVWIRAVRRSQEAILSVEERGDPRETAVEAALATYDFCLRHPDDARLLGAFRLADFLAAELPIELLAELRELNPHIRGPLVRLAHALYGRSSRTTVDLVLMAVVDIPYGCARPHVEAETTPPRERRERLAAAVRAVLL